MVDVQSLEEVDYQIQITRVIHIMDDTIRKLKVAVCLLDEKEEYGTEVTRFLENMQKLKEIAATKLLQTVGDERSRKRSLAKAWFGTQEMRNEIRDLKAQLERRRENWQGQIDEKNKIVRRYKTRVNQLIWELSSGVIDITRETERKLRETRTVSTIRQSQLAGDVKLIMAEYKKLRLRNLFHEKELRAQRAKKKMELANWLSRFDTDVTKAQEELESLKTVYKEESGKLENLKVLFDEQEVRYNGVLAEKEADRVRSEEEVKMFLKNYSAKIIQRAWRSYRRRIIELKKAKRGKGKGKGKRRKAPTSSGDKKGKKG